MFTASLNDKYFEITSEESGLRIDNTLLNWDLVKISEGYFHILLENKSYSAEVIKVDIPAKSFSFRINGVDYTVGLKDKFDLLLEKMGLNSSVVGKVNLIKAPMPGLIIDLRVKEGDTVSAGDPLFILEAMKMENIITATGEGIVKAVHIKKGDSVEKNQVLIEF